MLETLKEKWNDILKYLKEEYDISDVSFDTWLLPLEVYALEQPGNIVKIIVPDELVCCSRLRNNVFFYKELDGVAFDAGNFRNGYHEHGAVFLLNISEKIGIWNDDLHNISRLL